MCIYIIYIYIYIYIYTYITHIYIYVYIYNMIYIYIYCHRSILTMPCSFSSPAALQHLAIEVRHQAFRLRWQQTQQGRRRTALAAIVQEFGLDLPDGMMIDGSLEVWLKNLGKSIDNRKAIEKTSPRQSIIY